MNLRGARQPGGQQTKLVCVVEVVDGNEIAAFVTALDLLPELRGCLITADALHITQTSRVAYLTDRGAHYLFTVKDNQPTLRRALAALPGKAAPPTPTPAPNVATAAWSPGLPPSSTWTPTRSVSCSAQGAMKLACRRTDSRTGATSTETVYAITSLGHRYADAVLLARWLRSHWFFREQRPLGAKCAPR
jgi:hypothetical protein